MLFDLLVYFKINLMEICSAWDLRREDEIELGELNFRIVLLPSVEHSKHQARYPVILVLEVFHHCLLEHRNIRILVILSLGISVVDSVGDR